MTLKTLGSAGTAARSTQDRPTSRREEGRRFFESFDSAPKAISFHKTASTDHLFLPLIYHHLYRLNTPTQVQEDIISSGRSGEPENTTSTNLRSLPSPFSPSLSNLIPTSTTLSFYFFRLPARCLLLVSSSSCYSSRRGEKRLETDLVSSPSSLFKLPPPRLERCPPPPLPPPPLPAPTALTPTSTRRLPPISQVSNSSSILSNNSTVS